MTRSLYYSRILDIPCKVCGDNSSGKHYNIFACDGCAGFFKRSIRRSRHYVCKGKVENMCVIDKSSRNQCRACRLKKCEAVGMNKDAVQNERGPRNSTLRKQALGPYYSEESNQVLAATGNIALAIQSAAHVPIPSYVPPIVDTPTIYSPHRPLQLGSNVIPIPSVSPASQSLLPCPPALVCEYAARLLFMNMQWAKNGPAFGALCKSDQITLLQETWKELFVIGSAQFLTMINFQELLEYNDLLRKHCSPNSFLNTVAEFQLILDNIRQLRLDMNEYTCLRGLAMFNSKINSSTKLVDTNKVDSLREECRMTLTTYIQSTYPNDTFRYGKIMLLMTTFSRIPNETIEELFFKSTIGLTSISRIIADLYEKSEQHPTFVS
ncbi:nuclear receptor subfamily 2 group E member 1 isoform X2 [Aethina tumida]|uniref:nuclear receptor subfamily 2 group E member 1 isoform X2 n=1 Tax=Aethina tumida TaxID=116153 RepID=UPI00096B5C0F|nr:nuclear receptor subfamily 2 group E member 1 isoform X2 [Aethina tumida]